MSDPFERERHEWRAEVEDAKRLREEVRDVLHEIRDTLVEIRDALQKETA